MTKPNWQPLSESEWVSIAPIFPDARKQGRPQNPDRDCLNALIWSRHTGEPWKAIPQGLGSRQTVWRRKTRWRRSGLWGRIVRSVWALRGLELE